MSFRDRIQGEVTMTARKRLIRELDRALASGVTVQDVTELTDIASGQRPGNDRAALEDAIVERVLEASHDLAAHGDSGVGIDEHDLRAAVKQALHKGTDG